MVIVWLTLLAAVPAPIGVLGRSADLHLTPAQARPVPGSLFGPATRIETGEAGFAELTLFDDTRIRLSAMSQAVIDADGFLLYAGRAAVTRSAQAGGPFTVWIPNRESAIAPGSEVILESSASLGSLVAVERGAVSFAGPAPVTAGAGQVVRLSSRAQPVIGAGGEVLRELSASEAFRAFGDRYGLWGALLALAAGVAPEGEAAPPSRLSLDPEVLRADPFAEAAERALRPPPFLETEVPPKGPNVKIELDYAP